MDKTALNARLVTTRLKSVFYHLKSVDCGKLDMWKRFGCQWKVFVAWFLLLVRLVFSRNDFLVVFRHVRVWYRKGAGRRGLGWDGLRSRCGLEVCGRGAGADKKFKLAQDTNVETGQH